MIASFPPWVFSVFLLAVMLVARELGYALERRRRQRADPADDGTKAEFALSAVLGLLALLIGFTFSLALARYETRRELVVSEANAMGTTWLRFDLLEPDQRDRARALMKQYASARLAYGLAGNMEDMVAASHRADGLQAQLWSEIVASVKPLKSTAFPQVLLAPANEMIDLAGERTAAAEAHVPARLFGTLALYAFVAAGLTGYMRGRFRTATSLVFILVALALGLVADLDNANKGLVRVPQEPIAAFLRSTDGS
jgi:protein-S-isoprenylcysteine O-methyltransferase Ste14